MLEPIVEWQPAEQSSQKLSPLPISLILKRLSESAFLKQDAPIKSYLDYVDRISLVKELVKSGEISEEFVDEINELHIIQVHYDLINQKIEEIKSKIDQNDQCAMADFAKLLLDQKEISDILLTKYKNFMHVNRAKLEDLQSIIQKIKIISDDMAARIIITML